MDAALNQACLSGLFQGIQMVENFSAIFLYHIEGLSLSDFEKAEIRKKMKANIRDLKKRVARGDFSLT